MLLAFPSQLLLGSLQASVEVLALPVGLVSSVVPKPQIHCL